MSRKKQHASAIAFTFVAIATLVGFDGSGAFAQEQASGPVEQIIAAPSTATLQIASAATDGAISGDAEGFISQPLVQALPENYGEEAQADDMPDTTRINVKSLDALVAATPVNQSLSKDMECLAGAIYFESKGEPLDGQLAVGRVIVNRANSGRFPSSYCGVVYQRSQFSFVRGGRMPSIRKNSQAWREAKAIASIAHDGSWDSPAQGALFFHARYVSPGWRLTRIAQVENHIFYR
jgi:N-acetylmuramoyl-L-alanine amidase